MPIMRLTQKLQKEMGLKPGDLVSVPDDDQPFMEWYANIFLINRKKQLIFVERQTLFSFTCENVSRKDLRERFIELFEKGLGKALFFEDARADVVKAVLAICHNDVSFTKTLDRRTLGVLNEFVKQHKWAYDSRGENASDRDNFHRLMLTRGFPGDPKDYKTPIEAFANAIKEQFGLTFEPQFEKFKGRFSVAMAEDSSMQGATSGNKASVFEVKLPLRDEAGRKCDVIREIVVAADITLEILAEVILAAYEFECDHCFGFYSDVKRQRGVRPNEVYELFVDLDQESPHPHAQGVQRTRIVDVFSDIGKAMRFLFDYGDCWEFIVRFKDFRMIEKGDRLPQLTRSVGAAPEQYPMYDE